MENFDNKVVPIGRGKEIREMNFEKQKEECQKEADLLADEIRQFQKEKRRQLYNEFEKPDKNLELIYSLKEEVDGLEALYREIDEAAARSGNETKKFREELSIIRDKFNEIYD
ncbi:MAG: hypothetical protein PHQ47_01275 [Candidatus Portnoybacteria bacterium]|nr:hypothetical protein [Candidatus Portnoybacteria bacterium]